MWSGQSCKQINFFHCKAYRATNIQGSVLDNPTDVFRLAAPGVPRVTCQADGISTGQKAVMALGNASSTDKTMERLADAERDRVNRWRISHRQEGSQCREKARGSEGRAQAQGLRLVVQALSQTYLELLSCTCHFASPYPKGQLSQRTAIVDLPSISSTPPQKKKNLPQAFPLHYVSPNNKSRNQ